MAAPSGDGPQPPRSRTTRILQPVQEFIGTEAAGGAVVFAAACIALSWANVAAESYFDFWHEVLTVDTAVFSASNTLQHWVNDALMAVFFFVVGLEIKRELVHGELSSPRRAALPVAAALGGMIVPALIYTAINVGGEGEDGWGIPMATDIAFALGVLALLGDRIPSSLRVFMLALAIVDDIGAILVIAVFYTESLQWDSMAIAALTVSAIVAVQALGYHNTLLFLLMGVVLWAAVYESGVHATIAGVILGLLTPARPYDPAAGITSPVERYEHFLHPWSSFLVVPIFALANAGIDLGGGIITDSLSSEITLGIVFGLVAGKFVGICVGTWVAVQLRLAHLPGEFGGWQIFGVGLVAGFGFTVSLFISELAFDERRLIDEARIGILLASVIAGVLGYTFLRLISHASLVPSGEQ